MEEKGKRENYESSLEGNDGRGKYSIEIKYRNGKVGVGDINKNEFREEKTLSCRRNLQLILYGRTTWASGERSLRWGKRRTSTRNSLRESSHERKGDHVLQ